MTSNLCLRLYLLHDHQSLHLFHLCRLPHLFQILHLYHHPHGNHLWTEQQFLVAAEYHSIALKKTNVTNIESGEIKIGKGQSTLCHCLNKGHSDLHTNCVFVPFYYQDQRINSMDCILNISCDYSPENLLLKSDNFPLLTIFSFLFIMSTMYWYCSGE